MNGRQRFVAVAAVLVVAAAAVVVTRGSGGVVAEVESVQGQVERDHGEEDWTPAAGGAELAQGHALRTGESSTAKVRVVGRTRLKVAPSTTIRFLDSKPDRPQFQVMMGSGEVEAGEQAVIFETESGPVRLQPRARVTVRRQGARTRVRVDFGSANLRWGTEEQRLVNADQDQTGELPLSWQAPEPAPTVAPEPEPSPQPVQETVTSVVTGPGATLKAPDAAQPQRLEAGEHELGVGDELRLSGRARVVLRQPGGATVRTQSPARLVVGNGALIPLRAIKGRVRAEAVDEPLQIQLPGGTLELLTEEGPSSAELDVGAAGASIQVRSGRARLTRDGKGTEELSAGSRATLSRGRVRVDYRPPVRTQVRMKVGETATVHALKLPVAVEFPAPAECGGGGAVVSLAGREVARGRGALRVWLKGGRNVVKKRCLDAAGEPGGPVQVTTVVARRDAAKRMVTRRAARNQVTADGRRYTVLYQTRLPHFDVVWPGAPAGAGKIHLDGASGSRTRAARDGKAKLPAGVVREGTTTFWLSAGGEQSPRTTIELKFDNAAPSAYLRSDPQLSPDASGEVSVAGVALPGSKVSLLGRPAVVSGNGRFSVSGAPPDGAAGVAVRIQHPQTGVHYYQRAIRGAGKP